MSINDKAIAFYDGSGTLSTQPADITVDSTAGGVELLAANTTRKALLIQNTGSANMRVAIGVAPTTTKGFQILPNGFLAISAPFPVTGQVKAIREGASSTTATAVEVDV